MKHLLFLDIETTGLSPDHSELLELSAIRVSADLTKELDVFDMLVKPEGEIPPFISKLTGITPEMVVDAADRQAVREAFAVFLHPTDIICGHNIGFDVGFLQAKGFNIPNGTLDTFPLCNVLMPDEESYSLEVLTKKYAIFHQNAHRALADVRANVDLYRILYRLAAELPKPLLRQYNEVLSKSDWNGRMLFDRVSTHPASVSLQHSTGQVSLFEAEPAAKNQPPKVLPALVRYAAEQAEQFLNNDGASLFVLPADLTAETVAYEAARLFHRHAKESVAVVTVNGTSHQPPPDFFRYAAPGETICSTLFEKWFQKKICLDENETTARLKILRHQYEGKPAVLSELSFIRQEIDIVRQWVSDDHVRCPSSCPAKAMQLNVADKKLITCDLLSLAACPAKNGIVVDADLLEDRLDRETKRNIAVHPLERWAESLAEEQRAFSDGILFGIGLLKRFITERAGESPYRVHFVFNSEILQNTEIENLRNGFITAHAEVKKLFPDDARNIGRLKDLGDFLAPEIGEDEFRYACLYPDGNLFLLLAPLSLQPELERLTAKKRSIVYTGCSFLFREGRYELGAGLNVPEEQSELKTEFDYTKKSLFLIPASGGNTRNSDSRLTADFVASLLPIVKDHLLVVFPGFSIAEKFSEEIGPVAEENGFRVDFAHNSSGKITARTREHKTILLATASNWSKVDFFAIPFAGCVLHRILFDPPPDPLTAKRLMPLRDEFSQVAIPKAIRHFRSLTGKCTLRDTPFFLACLDSHFTKRGGFTEDILRSLPPEMRIQQVEPAKMFPLITAFFESDGR